MKSAGREQHSSSGGQLSPEDWQRRLEIIRARLAELDELRSAAGIGPVCSVSDGLAYLNSEGAAEHRLSRRCASPTIDELHHVLRRSLDTN